MVLGNKEAEKKQRTKLKANIRKALPTADSILFICTYKSKKGIGVKILSGVTPSGGLAIHRAVLEWDTKAAQELTKAVLLNMLKGAKNANMGRSTL